MPQHHVLGRSLPGLTIIAASIVACNLQAAPSSGPPSIPSATAPAPTPASATNVPEASATASATVTPAATQGPPPVVAVSAAGGRLNVRRGPGPEYDTVGAFLDGQSSTATGRNENGKWVLINIPNTSKSLGWITLETKYTKVERRRRGPAVGPGGAGCGGLHPQLHGSRDVDKSDRCGLAATRQCPRQSAAILPGGVQHCRYGDRDGNRQRHGL